MACLVYLVYLVYLVCLDSRTFDSVWIDQTDSIDKIDPSPTPRD